MSQDPSFISFPRTIEEAELPTCFNFPFFFEPHPLCLEAAKYLQEYIQTQQEWDHNFGLDSSKEGLAIGKMFGVMLVKDKAGNVGYLTAFSGKLANKNAHSRFVPPVFDMLAPNSFYLKGEQELIAINKQLQSFITSEPYLKAQQDLANFEVFVAEDLAARKVKIKANKAGRAEARRNGMQGLSDQGQADFLEKMRLESVREQGELSFVQRHWKAELTKLQAVFQELEDQAEVLRVSRREGSNALQTLLFAEYNFLNALGEYKNVKEIFLPEVHDNPPSGAGECAAPKMLQYAYLKGYTPLSFAEFWWGAAPASEIRKHGQFYPACRGKCEPILSHMLQGMEVGPNPMLDIVDLGDELKTIFEDEHIIVVNKPAEMLSVPGKGEHISVWHILSQRYPDATGPLLVHRLDMATSGILIAAKTKEAHRYLQAQFINKTAKKTYIAVLAGVLKEESGRIDLPLRVDLDNRPHQLVCYEHGKKAITEWERISISKRTTRVRLFPITGRTHQLRVHCAHHAGLSTPIVGDDLYGTGVERLHLHAHSLSIKHPVTKQMMEFVSEPPF